MHLDAGRLQVDEFVARFAGVAGATTAAEVAALFADLPAPHPTLPGPPRGRVRTLVVVGAVALLAVAGLLGFVVGRGRPAAAPPPAVAAPTPSAPSTAVPGPSDASAAERSAVPPDAVVRRTTGPGLITLRPSQGVDLDDVTSPAWNVGTGCCDRDVGFAFDSSRLSVDAGHVVTTGPLEFATCFRETAYTNEAIQRGSLRPGDTLCVRTNGGRLALMTMVSASAEAVEFGATVWDPPVPS